MLPGTIVGSRYVVKQVLTRAWPVTWILVRDAQAGDAERVIQHIAFPEVDARTLSVRRARFEEAFEVARRTRHPNLVGIVDRVTVDDGECVVCECVDGIPMSLVVGMRVQVDVRQMLIWAGELCDVMAHLEHRPRPLLLGSLSPRDVLVTPRERVRLQLMLERFLHDEEPALYASSDFEIDARMEAFGCLLLEMLGDADREALALARRCFVRRGAGGYPDFPSLQSALAARRQALEQGPPAVIAPRVNPQWDRLQMLWQHLVRRVRPTLSAGTRPPER